MNWVFDVSQSVHLQPSVLFLVMHASFAYVIQACLLSLK